MKVFSVLPTLFLAVGLMAFGQNPTPAQQTTPHPQPPGAGKDIGNGTGDIGKGAAKGTGQAAEGVGKGAGDLVTLHPVGAAENVGKGGVEAGRDVGVGAAKGTGKVARGTGKLIAKPFHHKKKTAAAPSSTPQ
jgi:hypothetical protein